MIARYPFASGRLEVILNPTDFAAIDRLASQPTEVEKPKGPLLISVGRLGRQKRIDVMLEALALLRQHVPAVLWVCGEGPQGGALKRLAAKLGVDSAVSWFGFQDNPYALMRQADLFVLTSDYEGLPNSLIEAQGLGLPAVATRCPTGPDEIIDDGVTGILVHVGDVGAVADARLCAAYPEMGAKHRSRVRTTSRAPKGRGLTSFSR
jgi:glycosyltransferase involved in cell wall biosynthesis